MPNAVKILVTPSDASSHKKCAAWGQLWFLHQKLHFSYICRVLKYHFFHSHSHVWSNLSVLFHTVKEAKSIRILFDTLIDTLIDRIYYISFLCLDPCLSWHVATVECEISASFLPPPLAPGAGPGTVTPLAPARVALVWPLLAAWAQSPLARVPPWWDCKHGAFRQELLMCSLDTSPAAAPGSSVNYCPTLGLQSPP